MHGPPLFIDNKKRRLYLCGIIDDHSRLITGCKWLLSENSMALEIVLKEAILTYGIPNVFYCDNGAAFSSTHLQPACARLEIALIHSKPYDSPSRGKIERFRRTVREGFLTVIDRQQNYSLDRFNQMFEQWLQNHYYRVAHHSIGRPPLDCYLNDLKTTAVRRIEQNELDLYFYQTFKRTVKNDATISLNGVLFEVPPQYIGCKIEVRHPTGAPEARRMSCSFMRMTKPWQKLQKSIRSSTAKIISHKSVSVRIKTRRTHDRSLLESQRKTV